MEPVPRGSQAGAQCSSRLPGCRRAARLQRDERGQGHQGFNPIYKETMPLLRLGGKEVDLAQWPPPGLLVWTRSLGLVALAPLKPGSLTNSDPIIALDFWCLWLRSLVANVPWRPQGHCRFLLLALRGRHGTQAAFAASLPLGSDSAWPWRRGSLRASLQSDCFSYKKWSEGSWFHGDPVTLTRWQSYSYAMVLAAPSRCLSINCNMAASEI